MVLELRTPLPITLPQMKLAHSNYQKTDPLVRIAILSIHPHVDQRLFLHENWLVRWIQKSETDTSFP